MQPLSEPKYSDLNNEKGGWFYLPLTIGNVCSRKQITMLSARVFIYLPCAELRARLLPKHPRMLQ